MKNSKIFAKIHSLYDLDGNTIRTTLGYYLAGVMRPMNESGAGEFLLGLVRPRMNANENNVIVHEAR